MRHAYDQSSVPTALIESSDPETGDCLTDRYGYAAEIRALADWIEKRQIDAYAVAIPDVAEVIGWLRDEAERAEGQA
jgi:hypothetical protein